MGVANTKNVVNNTVSAIASVSSTIVADQNTQSTQQQIIRVDNTEGSVIIKGNTQIQKATIDMQALMNSFTSQKASQDVTNSVSQSAKSLVSGLNFGQIANAQNEINNYVSAALTISNNVSQNCSLSVGQSQEITVTSTRGDVRVEDNTQKQFGDIFQKCVQEVTANQEAFQTLQNTLDQSASATAQGLSEWAIVAMALIGLLSIVLPIVIGGISLAKIILVALFALMAIGGLVLIVLYFFIPPETIVTVMFSKGTNESCGPTIQSQTQEDVASDTSTDTSAPNAQLSAFKRAANICLDDKECVGLDWIGLRVNNDGSLTPLDRPTLTTFSRLRTNPCESTLDNPDDTKIVRYPGLIVSNTPPTPEQSQNGNDGDVFVNSATSQVLIFRQGSGYEPREYFLETPGSIEPVTVSEGVPGDQTPTNARYIDQNFTDPIRLYKYQETTDDDGNGTGEFEWVVESEVRGPGGRGDVPDQVNVSGYKTHPRHAVFLGIGIVMFLFGAAVAFALLMAGKGKGKGAAKGKASPKAPEVEMTTTSSKASEK